MKLVEYRLQFVLGTGLSSRAIAWFSAGHFSHVDYVMDDGHLFGARSDRILDIPPGVRIRPPNYEQWKRRLVMTLMVTPEQKKRAERFLITQLGAPYDHEAILGFMTGRDWRAEDSWICSELQAAAIEYTGISPQLYVCANKITPVALALTASALGAIVT